MSPEVSNKVSKYDLINHLIRVRGYKSCLEISTPTSGCGFRNVTKTVHRERIWSRSHRQNDGELVTYRMDSDTAFNMIRDEGKHYDIILVDGFHSFDQQSRDVIHSLERLTPNGTVLVHDACPPHEWMVGEKQVKYVEWSGDAYKVVVQMRMTRPDLSIRTVDTDLGCALIRNEPSQIPLLTGDFEQLCDWTYFQAHRREILNMITTDEFFAFDG